MQSAYHDDYHGNTEIEQLERLAARLDRAFRLPGTNIRFGWDAILGLIPGLGDAATLAPSGYIILRAHQLGAPMPVTLRMALNAGADWLIGTIPLIGDVFDVGFKANLRNVALLRAHVEAKRDKRLAFHHATPREGKMA